jgi:hypothetical protein
MGPSTATGEPTLKAGVSTSLPDQPVLRVRLARVTANDFKRRGDCL